MANRSISSDTILSLSVGLVTAGALVALALSQGAYDIVDRQTTGILLWWAVGLGALVVAPAPRRPPLPGLLATGLLLATGVWIAATLGSSISQERTVTELARVVTHIGPLMLIGWVLPARLWRAVVGGLLVGGIVVCGVSLGERLSPGFLGQSSMIVLGGGGSRLASPLGYWNAVGSWCALTALGLVAVSAHSPVRLLRGAALAAVPLATTVAYMTYSRATIAAAAVGVLALAALSGHQLKA